MLFGAREKYFEKYESDEIVPSAWATRLLRQAMEKPDLFKAGDHQFGASAVEDSACVREDSRAAYLEHLYELLFAEPV
jgi:hypothetical protein